MVEFATIILFSFPKWISQQITSHKKRPLSTIESGRFKYKLT